MANKKKRRGLVVTTTIIVLVIAVATIYKMNSGVKGETVELEKPQMREIVEIISANGKIQPVTEVKISPDVSGEIVELNVAEGDNIPKGFLLLKIKPDIYISVKERTEAALNSSKAQKEQIEVQLAQASVTNDRNKQLYAQNAITKAEAEESQTQVDNLAAQLKMAIYNIASAQATLKESDENLQKTTIFSPTEGTVSKLDVELGERVVGTGQMAGTEMLRVADLARMEAEAEVNENDIVRVNLGDTANVEVDAYIGKIFKGVVTQIANTAKETTSADQVTNFEVVVFILPESYEDLVTPSNRYPLRPGMSCTVDIITARKRAISIPIQSIATREIDGRNQEVAFIYKADSSNVEMRKVVSGIQDTKFIEVIGIDSTEMVVTSPYSAISKTLASGQAVTYIDPNKKK